MKTAEQFSLAKTEISFPKKLQYNIRINTVGVKRTKK